jgi:hypothetical protein
MRGFFRNVRMSFPAAAVCAVALGSAGCLAGDGQQAIAEPSQALAITSQPGLLAGPWAFASSDIDPDNSYAIHGNEIDLNFNGYFRWNGTWNSGYKGYTFTQPVSVIQGGRYRLSVAVSNTNTQIPSVLRASLSGAGAEQQKSISGNGTIDFDFTVVSDPGAAMVALTAHPVLGHLGPTEGVGIGVQTYSVTASLTRLPSTRATDLGDGSMEFAVVLPSGQAYVEVFVRQNGIQNVAQNIVDSEQDNGDGTSTYSYVRSGYSACDAIDYRFYSYLPSSPGIFTPGPIESLWLSIAYGAPDACGTRFVVDHSDDSTNGVCASDGSSAGQCNLRAAVQAAATAPAPINIELAVDSTINQGEIPINAPAGDGSYRLTIKGASPRRIDGSKSSRLFNVGANATLALENLIVSNFSAFSGGAITSHGNVELVATTLSQNSAYCAGIGAQTAYALCSGGAIDNYGRLAITGGTRFENNSIVAEAMTAAFTTSWTSGGAIASSGTIIVDGPVAFVNNRATATSISGVHPFPFGGADASAAGGAIYNAGGSVTFTAAAIGNCTFTGNAAAASATSINSQPGTASSVGGAIFSQGQLVLPDNACVFQNNQALTDSDVHSQ